MNVIPFPAQVDRSPKGGDREDGLHAQHESAVAQAMRTPICLFIDHLQSTQDQRIREMFDAQG